MSIDTGTGASPYEDMKRNRHKINNMTLGFTNTSPSAPKCSICLEQWKLQVSTNSDGHKIGTCIRGCGTVFQLDEQGDSANASKYTTKFGTANNQKYSSFIISQPRRKSKDALAEAELQDDIRKLTGSRSVTVKDSQQYDATEGPI